MNHSNLALTAQELVTKVGGWHQVLNLAGIDSALFPREDNSGMRSKLSVIARHYSIDCTSALNRVIDLCRANLQSQNLIRFPAVPPLPVSSEVVNKRELIRDKFISESSRIENTLAETYLRSVGLKLSLDVFNENLMFHPNLPYRRSPQSEWEYHPALLSKFVSGNGKLVSVNRSYLNKKDDNGEVKVFKEALLTPSVDERGGCVRLADPITHKNGNAVLGLAVSVESALSILEGTGFPVWATLNHRLLESVIVPRNVSIVFVFMDKEIGDSGKLAYTRLKRRLDQQNKYVTLFTPRSDNSVCTWSEQYRKYGANAFPQNNIVSAVNLLARC